jgi:hypothetical protein
VPTNAPTTTPTLTETPDPNKPVGTLNADGSITVVENNQPHKFSKTSYTINNETITFWGRLLTPSGGVPLFDWPGYPQFMIVNNLLSFNVQGGETMQAFAHTNKTNADINNEDMTARMSVMVYVNKFGNNPSSSEMGAFNRQLLGLSGRPVSIDFYTNSPDNMQHWFFSSHGAVGIISNWDSLNGAPEYKEPYGAMIRLKVLGIDENGELVYEVATNASLDKLNQDQKNEIFYVGVANVIDHQDQRQVSFTTVIRDILSYLTNQQGTPWIHPSPDN